MVFFKKEGLATPEESIAALEALFKRLTFNKSSKEYTTLKEAANRSQLSLSERCVTHEDGTESYTFILEVDGVNLAKNNGIAYAALALGFVYQGIIPSIMDNNIHDKHLYTLRS